MNWMAKNRKASRTPNRATGWRWKLRVGLCLGLISAAILVTGLKTGHYGYMGVATVGAEEWAPISPDELKMTSLAEAPGAPAVILYRQVDRDDNSKTGNEQNYVRIKILTEQGRKFADVEIPFFREQVKDPSVPLAKVNELRMLYRIIASDERNTAVLRPATMQ